MRKAICAVTVIGLVVASLTGCSKSNPAGPSSSNPLVGTWNLTQQITISSSGVRDTSTTATGRYIISSNNTFTYTQNSTSGSSDMSGTWSATADSITFAIPAILTQKDAYVISGTTLTLTYEQELFSQTETVIEKYTKQ
jgi:hypothetical protein